MAQKKTKFKKEKYIKLLSKVSMAVSAVALTLAMVLKIIKKKK